MREITGPADDPLPGKATICTEALTAIQVIDSDWARSRALRALAPHLLPQHVSEALALARAMGSPSLRARTLLALAQAVPADQHRALVDEAQQAIRTIASPAEAGELLVLLSAHLTGEAQAVIAAEALAAAPGLLDEYQRGWLLAELGPRLSPAARLDALAAARTLQDPGARASTLAALAPHLPEGLEDAVLDEAQAAVRGIADHALRARAWVDLLPALPHDLRPTAAVEALKAAGSVIADDALEWARIVRWIAGDLPADAVEPVVQRALALTDPEARADALAALATLVSPGTGTVASAALDAAAQVADEWTQVALISRLAPALSPQQLERAVTLARALRDGWARASLLVKLASQLPGDHLPALLSEALGAARSLENPWARARALTVVAARLAD